ncbi:hypothetical protein DFH06DRAFT_1426635 [Mycena polygramma]|nr:hypothetical protein DFH06DRAFT_1426635 [Mycena polygramma]
MFVALRRTTQMCATTPRAGIGIDGDASLHAFGSWVRSGLGWSTAYAMVGTALCGTGTWLRGDAGLCVAEKLAPETVRAPPQRSSAVVGPDYLMEQQEQQQSDAAPGAALALERPPSSSTLSPTLTSRATPARPPCTARGIPTTASDLTTFVSAEILAQSGSTSCSVSIVVSVKTATRSPTALHTAPPLTARAYTIPHPAPDMKGGICDIHPSAEYHHNPDIGHRRADIPPSRSVSAAARGKSDTALGGMRLHLLENAPNPHLILPNSRHPLSFLQGVGMNKKQAFVVKPPSSVSRELMETSGKQRRGRVGCWREGLRHDD